MFRRMLISTYAYSIYGFSYSKISSQRTYTIIALKKPSNLRNKKCPLDYTWKKKS